MAIINIPEINPYTGVKAQKGDFGSGNAEIFKSLSEASKEIEERSKKAKKAKEKQTFNRQKMEILNDFIKTSDELEINKENSDEFIETQVKNIKNASDEFITKNNISGEYREKLETYTLQYININYAGFVKQQTNFNTEQLKQEVKDNMALSKDIVLKDPTLLAPVLKNTSELLTGLGLPDSKVNEYLKDLTFFSFQAEVTNVGNKDELDIIQKSMDDFTLTPENKLTLQEALIAKKGAFVKEQIRETEKIIKDAKNTVIQGVMDVSSGTNILPVLDEIKDAKSSMINIIENGNPTPEQLKVAKEFVKTTTTSIKVIEETQDFHNLDNSDLRKKKKEIETAKSKARGNSLKMLSGQQNVATDILSNRQTDPFDYALKQIQKTITHIASEDDPEVLDQLAKKGISRDDIASYQKDTGMEVIVFSEDEIKEYVDVFIDPINAELCKERSKECEFQTFIELKGQVKGSKLIKDALGTNNKFPDYMHILLDLNVNNTNDRAFVRNFFKAKANIKGATLKPEGRKVNNLVNISNEVSTIVKEQGSISGYEREGITDIIETLYKSCKLENGNSEGCKKSSLLEYRALFPVTKIQITKDSSIWGYGTEGIEASFKVKDVTDNEIEIMQGFYIKDYLQTQNLSKGEIGIYEDKSNFLDAIQYDIVPQHIVRDGVRGIVIKSKKERRSLSLQGEQGQPDTELFIPYSTMTEFKNKTTSGDK